MYVLFDIFEVRSDGINNFLFFFIIVGLYIILEVNV